MGGDEIEAGEVVVCAGAIHSPAILLRSRVERRGIGRSLRDHPAIPIPLTYRGDGPDPRSLPISVVGRRSSGEVAADLQLLPIDHLGPDAPGIGMLMVALMQVHSAGSVRLASDDPVIDPVVEFDMLGDERDERRLRLGVAARWRSSTIPPTGRSSSRSCRHSTAMGCGRTSATTCTPRAPAAWERQRTKMRSSTRRVA